MLAPHNRTQLIEALRPPDGYQLSDAIATTYSLDLLALLVAPIGFTSFELQDSDGPVIGADDRLTLLRTIRRHAGNMTLFCQAGQISDAPAHSRLLSALEPCVVEVSAPFGGLFHPKVWVLRYVARVPDIPTPNAEPESGVRYRVIVATRNLTFDRSWDTILTLDGVLANRTRGFSENGPLAEFVAALPSFGIRKPISDVNNSRVVRLSSELRRVAFEQPAGIDKLAFCPVGIEGYRRSPIKERADKFLVVSPFLADTEVSRLAVLANNATIISRPETFAALSEASLDGWTTFTLAADADFTDEPVDSGDEAGNANKTGTTDLSWSATMRGLHAKLYVSDYGWNSCVWTGSANATNAAFSKNVEFLVEMRGKRSKCGVDVFLDSTNGTTAFRDLLVPFEIGSANIEIDADAIALDRLLSSIRQQLGAIGWRAIASENEETKRWNLEFRSASVPSEELMLQLNSLRARPITLNESHGLAMALDSHGYLSATFSNLAIESLIAFINLSVQVTENGKTAATSFVVSAHLEGAPEARNDAILRSLLQDRDQVLRYLLMLLTEDMDGYGGHSSLGHISISAWNGSRSDEAAGALLEPLMRLVHRAPERLEEIAQFARDLAPRTDDEASKLPAGLQELVATLQAAHARLK